jgi:hypothetical protein
MEPIAIREMEPITTREMEPIAIREMEPIATRDANQVTLENIMLFECDTAIQAQEWMISCHLPLTQSSWMSQQ